MAGFKDGDPSALPVGAVILVVYDYSDVRFKKTASGWVRTERGVRYNSDGSYTPFDKGPKAVNEAQIRREMANGKRVEIKDAKPVMDAKKTWAIIQDMMQGKFTSDAISDPNDALIALERRVGTTYKYRWLFENDLKVEGFSLEPRGDYLIASAGGAKFALLLSVGGAGGKNDKVKVVSVKRIQGSLSKDASDLRKNALAYEKDPLIAARERWSDAYAAEVRECLEEIRKERKNAKDAKGKLVGSGTGGFNLIEPSASEYAAAVQSSTAWKLKRYKFLFKKQENGTITSAEKNELYKLLMELAHMDVSVDESPIKTGGYVQLELEERQMAGWARRSGGKQPGWYVYQDGECYAGPYYSRAEGEEGLRLANRLHPGHKYDLRVIGTKDAKDVKPTTDSGWVEGEMDGCKYQAKVFEEGSMYGIKGGSVSKLEIRKNGKPVLEYDRGSWSGDKQYRNLAYKIANKYDRNVRREPEEAKAYAKWINSGDAKDVAYWEDPKNLSPRDLLREVNEAQVKIQRIKDKGSKEYKDAKAWLDKLMAEVVKRNRAHGAAGGI